MVDYKYADLFLQSSVDRQIKIETDSGTLTNEELFWENLEISESLCSENELRFGSCEASQIKFKVAYRVIPMINKEIAVTEILEGAEDAPFQFGKYKVQSDKPTADRQWRDIVAYDAMYDIINAEVSTWYNTILPNDNSQVPMRQFRKSFLDYFGIEEDDPSFELVNDNMTVQKTVQPTSISGKDVITAICEINGCFGHITREGKFRYIYLPQNIQGLYPADDLYPDRAPDYLIAQQETGHLYPQDPKATEIKKGQYKSCHYENYLVRTINKLQIRQNENDIGCIYGTGNNTYIIEDNFLVYGKNAAELEEIAKNIYDKITYIIYRPFDAVCIGNPCFEVGDPVRFSTQYELVESYILERTFKGIQAPMDTYRSDGTEVYSEQVNSVSKSIVQLRGKTNELTRNVDETRSTLTDTANNLQSQITQNAGEIDLRARKDNIISEINLTPESITIKAQRIDLVGLVNAQELVSKFATIDTLNAASASLQNLIAQKATIADLNVATARITALETDRITASEVEAKYATISSLNAVNAKFTNLNADNIKSGKISADRLDINEIVGAFSAVRLYTIALNTSELYLSNVFQFQGVSISMKSREFIDGEGNRVYIAYLG